MQHVLVAVQYEEASSYSILLKSIFCNFTLWMPGAVALSPLRLHASDCDRRIFPQRRTELCFKAYFHFLQACMNNKIPLFFDILF